MGRLAVADLILLAAAASALVVGLLTAALLLLCRRRWSSQRPPTQLPITEPPLPKPKKRRRRSLLLLLLLLCSRRRTRVEPASANSAGSSPAPGAEEDVATWRERWFGPTSRALYTIDEELSDGETEDQEPETGVEATA